MKTGHGVNKRNVHKNYRFDAIYHIMHGTGQKSRAPDSNHLLIIESAITTIRK